MYVNPIKISTGGIKKVKSLCPNMRETKSWTTLKRLKQA